MKIAFDTMGFENHISEATKAAKEFCKKNKDVEIILVGKKELLEKNYSISKGEKISILDASEVIEQNDSPLAGMRKRNSSLHVATRLVKEGIADGVLSAGSTTTFVPVVNNILGLIPGITKLSFMPYIPTTDGQGFNMLDIGANIEVTASDLVLFSRMANIYCKYVRKIKKPRISILNIGTENHKGHRYIQEANNILSVDKEINYIGFSESKKILSGICDVLVTDGFTGNVCLKALEGTLKGLISLFKKEYKKPHNWLAALLSLFIFKNISKTFDYKNNAGAIVLGVNGVAIKTHGSADKKQFLSSLRLLKETVDAKLITRLQDELNKK